MHHLPVIWMHLRLLLERFAAHLSVITHNPRRPGKHISSISHTRAKRLFYLVVADTHGDPMLARYLSILYSYWSFGCEEGSECVKREQ